MKTLICQDHTLEEVVDFLNAASDNGETVMLQPRSAAKLAEWIKELHQSKDAIYQARIALAKAKG